MKKYGLFFLPAVLILLTALLPGCRNFCIRKLFQKDAPCACSAVPPGDGWFLLGNDTYTAVSYSGYRTDTRTAENCPTVEQLKEDMKILSAMGIRLLRTYNTQAFPQTERMLQAIYELKQNDPEFEMYVMVGAWIQCKGAYGPMPDHTQGDRPWNQQEIDTAIAFANTYPDIVKIIAVGNEAMVTWQAHFVPPSEILSWVRYLKKAESSGRLPAGTLITTSDNWAALGGTADYRNADLLMLLNEIDFVSLHTYAFHDTYYDPGFEWAAENEQEGLSVQHRSIVAVERAAAHQAAQVVAVRQYLKENGIDKPIHIGETGWATMDNSHYGDRGTCAADEYKATLFYDAMRDWTEQNGMSCFYFEAFDEPWKSGGTAGSEGHFGLFTADGRAKYMLWDLVDQGVFDGLTRGGNPITKTYNGNRSEVLKRVNAPARFKFPP